MVQRSRRRGTGSGSRLLRLRSCAPTVARRDRRFFTVSGVMSILGDGKLKAGVDAAGEPRVTISIANGARGSLDIGASDDVSQARIR